VCVFTNKLIRTHLLPDYPEKRSDMLQLADRLTVPQIFFNDRHMGGASDVEQMLSDGRLFPCAYVGVRSGFVGGWHRHRTDVGCMVTQTHTHTHTHTRTHARIHTHSFAHTIRKHTHVHTYPQDLSPRFTMTWLQVENCVLLFVNFLSFCCSVVACRLTTPEVCGVCS